MLVGWLVVIDVNVYLCWLVVHTYIHADLYTLGTWVHSYIHTFIHIHTYIQKTRYETHETQIYFYERPIQVLYAHSLQTNHTKGDEKNALFQLFLS